MKLPLWIRIVLVFWATAVVLWLTCYHVVVCPEMTEAEFLVDNWPWFRIAVAMAIAGSCDFRFGR